MRTFDKMYAPIPISLLTQQGEGLTLEFKEHFALRIAEEGVRR
jgi:hypothetical protein